jgi:hypothetical protein
MNCPVCGAEVTLEQCDVYSGVCHECMAKAAEQRGERPRRISPVLRWAGRIGHVLLCAVVCAPFGVLGLGILGILGIIALAPILAPLAAVWFILSYPIHFLFGAFLGPWPAASPASEPGDYEFLRAEAWKAFPAFVVAMGILVVCYYMGGWQAVLITAAAIGALIGAVLSILSQLPAKAKAGKASS